MLRLGQLLIFLLVSRPYDGLNSKSSYDDLASKITSSKFIDEYEDLLKLERNENLEKSCFDFLESSYGDFFYKVGRIKDKDIFQEKMREYYTFISNFVEVITPRRFSFTQKEFIANFMLWTYIYDDAITSLIDKLNSNHILKAAGSGLVESLNNHVYSSWLSGLEGNDKPEYNCPNFCSRILFNSDKINAFKDITDVSFIFASKLSNYLSEEMEPLLEIVSSEFLATLNGITEQSARAPETVSSYFERHKKTGGIKLFFSLNILFHVSNMSLTLDAAEISNLLRHDPLISAYLSSGEDCIIFSNDASGAKDIGGDDESLLAIYIGEKVIGQRLNTARDHGQVLAKYLATEEGFQSMVELNENLRASFFLFNSMLDAIQKYSTDSVIKQTLGEAIVPWVYGYHIYSPLTSRYGPFFRAYMIALTGDFDRYRSYLESIASE